MDESGSYGAAAGACVAKRSKCQKREERKHFLNNSIPPCLPKEKDILLLLLVTPISLFVSIFDDSL